MRLAGTRLRNHESRRGLTIDTKAGPVWNGKVRFNEQWLDQPLRWTRPRMIFVCAHGDLFHESVPDEWLDRVFAVMALAPQHIFQVLTKRPERMLAYLTRLVCDDGFQPYVRRPGWTARDPRDGDRVLLLREEQRWPLQNVWLGFSAEDQARFDERWPHMEKLAWAGWLTWLSAEPLLGPIDATAALWSFRPCPDCPSPDLEKVISEDCCRDPEPADGLKWIVAGGESGPGARPAHPDWFRQLRDDCQRAEAAFHFKQWGAWAPGESIDGPQTRSETGATFFAGKWVFEEVNPKMGSELHRDDEPEVWRVGKKRAGRLLDGVLHDGFPEEMRV